MAIPLPPPELQEHVGPAGYERIGPHFLRLFTSLGGLEPHHDVLDVGCGSGRIARTLTTYMTGRYDGFDISADAIRWCTEEITSRYPSFRFQHADIANTRYNPSGEIVDRDYRFPYEDASFDFSFLTSVFTHMLPDGVRNYVGEVSRVLRPGGRCFVTWCLLNDTAERAIREGKAKLDFPHDFGVYRTMSKKVPEAIVAYQEAWAVATLTEAGLAVEAVHPGFWSRPDREGVSRQDIVVATKG